MAAQAPNAAHTKLGSCLIAILGCAVLTATGCGTTTASFVGESRQLPLTTAGQPVNVSIPTKHLQRPPLLIASRGGDGRVNLFSKGRWHGKKVTIYYVPARNIEHDGGHYDITSTLRLQQVATARVSKDGSWSTTWWTGAYRPPAHQQVFLLAKSDAGEIRLIQVNTLN